MQDINRAPQKPAGKGKIFYSGSVPLAKGTLVVDLEHCAGCRNCMYACSLRHDGVAALDIARIQVTLESAGVFDVGARACLQCADPQCLRYCPVGAVSADPDTGARVIDGGKCIGCKSCIRHCPYEPPRIRFDAAVKKAVKCDLCGGDPQCVRVCPNGCLTFRYDPAGVRSGYGAEDTE